MMGNVIRYDGISCNTDTNGSKSMVRTDEVRRWGAEKTGDKKEEAYMS